MSTTGQTTSTITQTVSDIVGQVRRRTQALSWVSRAAWVLLALGTAALVGGYFSGWIEIRVLGAGFLGAVGAAAIFAIGRHPYAINLRLREGRVVVGQRAMGGVDVRNTGDRPVLPARIEMPVGQSRASFALPAMAPGQEHDELFVIPTHRRGVITVGPVSSVRGDPLGLVRRSVLWTEPEELYVHPATVRMGSSAAGFLHDLEGQETRDVTNADLSFHALREYGPGDDRRYVHWRSSAKTGTLMVRQFEETRRSHMVVALSAQDRDYAESEEFELAISAVGSLGLEAIRSSKDLTAMATHEVIPSTTSRQLLEVFTRLESVSSPLTLVDLARSVTRDVLRATVVVLVCGSSVSARDIRAAGAVLPLGVRALAIQTETGVERGVSRLGSVTVLKLGALQDLPRGFRRMERV